MTKRPGTQSGEDRDAKALQQMRRTSRSEQPEDGFTPVRHILDLIQDEHPELGPVVQAIWAHVANVEMRANQRMGDETANESIHRRIDEQQDEISMIHQQLSDIRVGQSTTREELVRKFADLTGADGTNGKVGTIRASLEKLHSRIWWGVTAVVGGIGSVVVKLIIVGKTYGEMETQIETNRTQIQFIQSIVFKQILAVPGKVQ